MIIAAPTLIATNTPTPSPTVAVTATPTPHGVVVTFDQPTVSRVGDSFVVQGNLLGAQSNQVYALKIEGSSSGDTWFDAQTQSPTGEYLAWNASWDNFPTTVINSTSSISFDLRARIRSDRPAGNYQIRIKAKPVGGTNIEVSTVRTIVLDGVLSLTPTPSVVEEPDGDIEEIQTTPVHDAKAMTDGSEVSVSGIVSVVPGLIGPRVFYLQDSTGGIQVQMPTGFNNQIQLGETFEVVGEIHHRSGIVYLNVPNESDVTSQGIVVAVTPQVVAIESLDTDDEGRLVSVEGTVNQVNGNVITLKHGSAELKVQFKEAAFPKRPTIKKGMVAKVVGVLTLSKDELRVLPRTSQDVVVGPNEGGSVLGANGSLIGLPKTGGWAILHGLVTVLCGWFLKRVWVLF